MHDNEAVNDPTLSVWLSPISRKTRRGVAGKSLFTFDNTINHHSKNQNILPHLEKYIQIRHTSLSCVSWSE